MEQADNQDVDQNRRLPLVVVEVAFNLKTPAPTLTEGNSGGV